MAGSRYVLLVEDNAAEEALALKALRTNGFGDRVVVVHDGMAALDYLAGAEDHAHRDAGRQPAVMVVDLDLPRIDGFEVLRRVRADLKASLMPVVVFAASRKLKDIHEAYRLGANSYVAKPQDPQEFERTMAQIARYWLTLNEPADDGIRF